MNKHFNKMMLCTLAILTALCLTACGNEPKAPAQQAATEEPAATEAPAETEAPAVSEEEAALLGIITGTYTVRPEDIANASTSVEGVNIDYTFTIHADGTAVVDGTECTWTFENKKFHVSYEGLGADRPDLSREYETCTIQFHTDEGPGDFVFLCYDPEDGFCCTSKAILKGNKGRFVYLRTAEN